MLKIWQCTLHLVALQYSRILLIARSGGISTCYLKDTACVHWGRGTPYTMLHSVSCFLRCDSWGHLSTTRQRQCGGDRFVCYSNDIDISLVIQLDYIFYLAFQLDVDFDEFWPIKYGWCQSLPGSLKPDIEKPAVDSMPRKCQGHKCADLVPGCVDRGPTWPLLPIRLYIRTEWTANVGVTDILGLLILAVSLLCLIQKSGQKLECWLRKSLKCVVLF